MVVDGRIKDRRNLDIEFCQLHIGEADVEIYEFNITSLMKPMIQSSSEYQTVSHKGTFFELSWGRIERNMKTGEVIVLIYDDSFNHRAEYIELLNLLNLDSEDLKEEIIKRLDKHIEEVTYTEEELLEGFTPVL